MRKYEFKKFPALATFLTIAGLILSVISISLALMSDYYVGGYATLAIMAIIGAVLFLAGITTGRVVLLRVVSIIVMVANIITSFVLALVKFGEKDVALFAISLLMLIASILELIYFLTMKNERISKMYFYAGLSFSALAALYGLVFIVNDIIEVIEYVLPGHYHVYFLVFAFALVSVLPPIIQHSLTLVEVPEVVEAPQEETKENIEAVEENKEEATNN